jgi:hypothetical protein
VPGSSDKKGGRRCHLLLYIKRHLLPLFCHSIYRARIFLRGEAARSNAVSGTDAEFFFTFEQKTKYCVKKPFKIKEKTNVM